MAELDDQLASIGATDTPHKEWRIFGPPGCGKTFHIKKQVARAVAKYGPEAVLVTSFSKAAAAELAGRDLPIDPMQIGTLHAHCYRALGRPNLAEGNVKSWNEANPRMMITPSRDNSLDPLDERGGEQDGVNDGNELLAEVNRWRNLMLPQTAWSRPAVQFYQIWDGWKKENHYLDYTDLLEVASRNCAAAPRNPKVIFGDEAQDFTRLQLTLVRKWGEQAEYFVVVGDDDQTIYQFTGATPEAFLLPEVPAGQKIVLSQSYRVPQAVHALAVRWIGHVKRREQKEYRPTAVTGMVNSIGLDWKDADRLVEYAMSEVAAGRSVMFLGACAYMLGPVRHELINQAIPFWNPYRLKRGDWNPLRNGNGVSASDRLLAFATPHHSLEWSRPWTAKEVAEWAEWIDAKGTFARGGKGAAAKLSPDTPVTQEQLAEWLEPGSYASLMNSIMNDTLPQHLRWWANRVMRSHSRTADFPANVAITRGLKALTQPPRIILGTIHSVKGGESDTVILFPDLPWKAFSAIENGRIDEIDALYRQFYVGMTRARHTLAICSPEGRYGVGL